MAKSIKMEIFRAGNQTDSAGNSKKWTTADLDEIVKNFNDGGEDVAAVIGHPEQGENAPAFAWFKKVWREGETLFAEMSEIVDEFGVMLKNKMFKRRSIGLAGGNTLDHIAFLGKSRPAIKGLKDFKYSKENGEVVTFSELELDEIELDESLSFMDNFKNALKALNINFNETQTEDLEMEKIEQLENEIETLKGNFAEAEKKSETLESDLKAANEEKLAITNEFSEYKANEKTVEYENFVDEQIEAGKVLPANKNAIMNNMKIMDGNEAQEFSSESNKDAEKVTPLEMYKESVINGPTLVEFDENFKKGKARSENTDKEISEKAHKLAKEKGLSFSDAMREVVGNNSEIELKLNA